MFYRRKARTAAIALLAAGALALTGCAKSGGGSTASGVPLVAKDKLTVCVNTPYPPFQSKDSAGQIAGFDVDVMGLVAKKLGVTVSVVDTPFEGIKSGLDLKTGKCDVAAAGLTVDDERRKAMDFSDPYFDNTQGLVIRPGDAEVIKTADQLKGRRVAVQGGTTGAQYANKLKVEKGFEVVEYSDFGLQQQALATKQVDASIADLPVLTEYVRQNPNQISIIQQFDTGEKYAYAVKKGADPKLLGAVNDTLKAARADGSYAAIYEKWLGRKPS
ncbi:basic amino acid ABC transporter substrate-binding protein [Longispora albida]|uniref:basic amino acid ABC transporter substrate-binding protein n=1 Tax=Longispora albida TaxID=203523 RepID=UPI00037DC60D|nr:basic amino acid ABC transporter substrate-binding protein [Longispora albida]